MAHVSDLIATDIHAYLAGQRHKSLLRFITCGSVDDGKSTLIGRLLYDSKTVFEDQLAAVAADSRKWGTQGEQPDLALLVDGLAAEREQGITIDVAYRFFSTDKRKFIVADTPGHEQYTRNMVTGASTAELAVILLDARKGVLTQTRRHSLLVQLLGIRRVVLAVNKMDLVGHAQAEFERLAAEYRAFAEPLGLADITCIPLSALAGDNVTAPSANMPWYTGPTLLGHLETVPLDDSRLQAAPLRLPVQWVNRPNADFRGYCGRIASGTLRTGDRVRVLPSGRETTVARIVAFEGDLPEAVAGQSVTVTLADETDVSRGDVLCAANDPAAVADQFECTLVWMDEQALLPGRPYLLKLGTATVGASVTEPRYKLNVNTMERLAAKKLELNDIGVCKIALDRPLPFEPYATNRDLGGFILIDRLTHRTVGAGLLHHALRRATNVQWQALEVDRAARRQLTGHGSGVIWLTGLSGAGKSTIANVLAKRLQEAGVLSYLLDGDNVRHGLSRDLGFTDEDRVENIRRVAEVAKLMVDAGVVVVTAFISPFRAERQMARELLGEADFVEVFVDAPLAVTEARDPKGLYRKARAGQLKHFTGIDSAYEAPLAPELHLDSAGQSPEEAAEALMALLAQRGWLRG
jgi:bifunctional enzyme CysN/CysC